MKKFPKIVQCDKRGQIVIPKDIRQELDIDEGTAFWMYSITDEGILLKKVRQEELSEFSPSISTLKSKSIALGINPKNIDKTIKTYKLKKSSGLLSK